MINLTALSPSISNVVNCEESDRAGISCEIVTLMLKAKENGQHSIAFKSLLHRCKHLSLNKKELIRLHDVLVKSHLWSPVAFFQSLLKFYILFKPVDAKVLFNEALECDAAFKPDFLSSFFIEHLKKAKKGNSNSGLIVNFFIQNPFVLAPSYRSLEILQDLLNAGAQISYAPFMGTSFMRWCLDYGHYNNFIDLLKKGAPIASLFAPRPISSLINYLSLDHQGEYPITSIDCLNKLLEINPDIDLNESLAGSLLEKAIQAKDIPFAEAIIRKGGNPFARNAAGLNSLLTLCSLYYTDHHVQIEFINLLLEKGVELMSKSLSEESTVLHLLCGNGYTSIYVVEHVLKMNFPVDIPNKLGLTAFDYAFRNENIPIMLKLMEYGSKSFDKYSNQELIEIIEENKSVELLQKLIQRGYDINTTDHEGSTLLFRGSNYGNLNWVKTILDLGGDVNLASKRGTTPLMMAIDQHVDVSKLLIEKDAKLFLINVRGQCAMDYLLQRDIPQLISHIATLYLDVELLQSFAPFTLTETGLSEFANAIEDQIDISKCPKDLFPFLCFSILFNYSKLSSRIFRFVPVKDLHSIITRLYRVFPELMDNLPYLMKHVLRFHKGHLIPKMTELTILPAPENINIEQILVLFHEINFTDSTQKNYINPEKVLNEYNKNLNIDELDKNLVTLCNYIRNKTPFVGTPKPNTLELITFYDRLELFLKHIIAALWKMENTSERGQHVIDIALAAELCGARWIGDMYEKYKTLCHPDYLPTFQDQVLSELVKLRSGIVRFISGDDVHDYNRTIRLLGIPLGIPGAIGMADLVDPLRPNSEGQPFRFLYIDFMKIYHPHVIYETVEFYLSLMMKKNIDLFYAWMSENIPDEWKKAYFDDLCLEIKQAEPRLENYNAILKKHDIPSINVISEIDDQIKKFRISIYMGEVFFDFERNKPSWTTVLTVLKKLAILSECRWNIIESLVQLAKEEQENRQKIPGNVKEV